MTGADPLDTDAFRTQIMSQESLDIFMDAGLWTGYGGPSFLDNALFHSRKESKAPLNPRDEHFLTQNLPHLKERTTISSLPP